MSAPLPKYLAEAGTRIYWGPQGSTPANEITSIKKYSDFPDSTRGKMDISRSDLVDAFGVPIRVKQYASGSNDPGKFSFMVGMDEGIIAQLKSMQAGGLTYSLKFVYSTGANEAFDGYIESCKGSADGDDGELVHTVTIQLASPNVFTNSASGNFLQNVVQGASGAKTVTLTFAQPVTAAAFYPGSLLIQHGTASAPVPATAISAGVASNQLTATSASWQTSSTGDTFFLLETPAGSGIPAPVSGTVG